MMKLNCAQKNMMAMALVLVVMWYFVMGPGSAGRSYFGLRPQSLVIKKKPNQPASIYNLKYDLECVPGPSAKSAYYSKGLTPGGICGDEAWVNAAMGQYKIESGVGDARLGN